MASSAQTPLGQWLTNTFTPAGKIAAAMGGKPDPTSPTPAEIAARKKKLMAAGQAGNSLGSGIMSLFGLGGAQK